MGGVRGFILAPAAKHSVPTVELSPPEIKSAIGGYGKADKKDVKAMLRFSIDLPSRAMLDDETDALAIAITAAVINGNRYDH